MALNTSRAPFSNVNLRKAVNYAVDVPAWLRVGGLLAGRRTDQILPSLQPSDARSTRSRAPTRRGRSSSPADRTPRSRSCTRRRRPRWRAADPAVQPPADGPPAEAEAAAVRRRHQDGRHQGSGLRRVHDCVVRRLSGPVRLHQRAAGRREHPGRQQQQLLAGTTRPTTSACWTPPGSPATPGTRRTGSSTSTSCGTRRRAPTCWPATRASRPPHRELHLSPVYAAAVLNAMAVGRSRSGEAARTEGAGARRYHVYHCQAHGIRRLGVQPARPPLRWGPGSFPII